jgi:hypothetical protein
MGYCLDSGDTAAGRTTLCQKFIAHGSLRWGLLFGCGGLSHAGVPCSLISGRDQWSVVSWGCVLPLASPFTHRHRATEHGLIDVLTVASSFKAPAIPTCWSRPTVMCHFPGPVAVFLSLFLIFPCFSLASAVKLKAVKVSVCGPQLGVGVRIELHGQLLLYLVLHRSINQVQETAAFAFAFHHPP